MIIITVQNLSTFWPQFCLKQSTNFKIEPILFFIPMSHHLQGSFWLRIFNENRSFPNKLCYVLRQIRSKTLTAEQSDTRNIIQVGYTCRELTYKHYSRTIISSNLLLSAHSHHLSLINPNDFHNRYTHNFHEMPIRLVWGKNKLVS